MELKENKFPLVTIGIPAYNSGGTIRAALNSILTQDYPEIEVIVSDDCSSDDTQALCFEMARQHPAIRYYRQKENIGLVKNFEFVMKNASSDLFMWVAHDDLLEPGVLKKYVEFMTSHPDYSLVSGQILYWSDDEPVFREKDFSQEHRSPLIRVMNYYFKVIHGAMFYGLMNRKAALHIPMRNRIGDDWHFVASLAFLGKIKTLDCIGYNKRLGGTSKTFKQYARAVGASKTAAAFPHLIMARDAFSEIMIRSPVYKHLATPVRFLLATMSCMGVLANHYVRVFPFILGGRIKRFLIKTFGRWLPGHGRIKSNSYN
jgi:glycosyltransferase involved in cell wall biosynthesis